MSTLTTNQNEFLSNLETSIQTQYQEKMNYFNNLKYCMQDVSKILTDIFQTPQFDHSKPKYNKMATCFNLVEDGTRFATCGFYTYTDPVYSIILTINFCTSGITVVTNETCSFGLNPGCISLRFNSAYGGEKLGHTLPDGIRERWYAFIDKFEDGVYHYTPDVVDAVE